MGESGYATVRVMSGEGDAPAEPGRKRARGFGSAGASPSPRLGFHILVVFCIAVLPGFATAEDPQFGSALIVGVGGAYAGAVDEPAIVWFNPAMSSFAEERGSFGLSYRRQYDLDELGEVDAAVRHRLTHGLTLGGGFARFGERGLFLETRGIVAGTKDVLDKYAVGAGIRYLRTEFGDNEAAFAGASLDLGVAGQPLPGITAGVSVRGITLDDLYERADQNPEVTTEASMAWSAPPDIVIAGVWSKEKGENSRFGLGQRLRIASGTEFISGLRFDPVRYTLGARLAHRGGIFDYVYQSHPDLGGTHTIGIGWQW